MSDKFSLDDILSEYGSKSDSQLVDNDDNVEDVIDKYSHKNIDDVVTEPADDIYDNSLNSQRGDNLSEDSTSVSNDYIADEIIQPVIENSEADAVIAEYKETAVEPEPSKEKFEDETSVKYVENILKMKREQGTLQKNTNCPPINRASVKDIDLGLTGKIIPKTEEINLNDVITEDVNYEEKSAFVTEKRKSKVENFKLKDEKDTDNKNNKDSDSDEVLKDKEFNSFDDSKKVLSEINQIKDNLTIRLIVLIFTSAFSLFITAGNDLGLPLLTVFDRTLSPSAYLFTNTILAIISVFVSYTVLFSGIMNIVKRKHDSDSVAALGVLVCIIVGIITLFKPDIAREHYYNVYTSVAIVGLLCNTIGKTIIIKRTEQNFRFVSGEYEKFAVVNVKNEDVAAKLTKGKLNDFPELASMHKTEFVKGFMKNSYSADIADDYAGKLIPIMIIASIVVGILSLFFEKEVSGGMNKALLALSVFSGTISICSSMSLMLIINVPMHRTSQKLLKNSAVMLGYSAVDEFADTNSILVDCDLLFPTGMVDLVNLKLTSSTMIEDCILMAASLACQAGSVLKPTFYKMLRGKTEMLYPVESYIVEDGQGISGWIDNKRVLLGTRELMENHSIEGIPTLAKEREYAKEFIPLYLSISGVVSTLFVVRVNANISVSRWLNELEQEKTVVVVRCVDGFINEGLLSRIFRVSEDSVRVLPFRYHKEFEKETEYVPEITSTSLCSGHFPSFAMLITGAKRIRQIANLGIALQFASAILGGAMALVMMLLGVFSELSASVVVFYNLVMVAITMFVQGLKKI